MSCEICGRSNCTRSFHSFESQNEFDSIADGIKERMRDILKYRVDRIKDIQEIDGKDYIPIIEVMQIIDNYLKPPKAIIY